MPKLSTLGQTFEVAKSLVSRTINTLIYDLWEVLKELVPISLPAHWTKHHFEGVVAAVDCTSHYRCRVHPGQALYYRGDKHSHFITAQVLCSMDGSQIYEVTLGRGHNNDSGMAILTGLKEGLLLQQVKVIADGGYGAMYAVLPTDKSDTRWRTEHAAWRSVVERVNARTASFAASCINTGKFRGSPELQTTALMCVYHLVQHGLANAPLYANGSGPAQWRWARNGLAYLDDASLTDSDDASLADSDNASLTDSDDTSRADSDDASLTDSDDGGGDGDRSNY